MCIRDRNNTLGGFFDKIKSIFGGFGGSPDRSYGGGGGGFRAR